MRPPLLLLALAVGGSVATAALTPPARRASQDDPTLVERFIRNRIQKLVQGTVRRGARVSLGRLTGSFLSQLAMDSVEIRDDEDSLVFRSGPVTARYSARDLIAGRWIFDELTIERPVLVLREHANGEWNYQRILARTAGPPAPAPVVRAGLLRVRGGSLRIALPWRPESWYTPRLRDSIVAARLKAGTMATTAEGLVQLYRWTALSADARALDASGPGRDGGSVNVVDADAEEHFPPFKFRNLRGSVRWFRDSTVVAIGGVALGKSRGSGAGVVRFVKGGGPPRLDFKARMDTLALADVAWISPVVPTNGGGRATLTVKTDAGDPALVHYALSDADVRTGATRVLGAVTFGVGQQQLRITNVALTLDPLGTKETEDFLGFPLPLGLTGAFRGTVKASGGPLDRFVLEEATATFVDSRAPRTTVPLKARGSFDLAAKGKTGFRALVVEAPRMDAPFVAALFPKAGIARGVAALTATIDARGDSMWVRDLRATYERRGVGTTRLTGRVALHRGAKGVDGYDARLSADSLRLTTFLTDSNVARVGALGGNLSARGDLEGVRLATDLAGPAGAITSDVAVHFSPGRTVAGTVALHDIAIALTPQGAPVTADAHATIDLTGDSLSVMTGRIAVDVDSTTFGAARMTAGSMRLRFANAHAIIDTLDLDAGVVALTGSGGIGLRSGVADTLRLALSAASLEALRNAVRPLVARRRPVDTTGLTAFLWDDTVRGSFALTAALSGRLDSVRALIGARVRGLQSGVTRADSIGLAADGTIVRDTLTGALDVSFTRGRIGAQPLDVVRAHVDASGPGRYAVAVDAEAQKGFDRLSARTRIALRGDTIDVDLDSLFAHFGGDTVRLRAPTRIVAGPGRVTVDSTRAELGKGGTLFLAATLVDSGAISGILRLEDFPLVVQDSAKQVPARATALLNARVELGGTRRMPRIEALLDAADVKLVGTAAGSVRVTGEYDQQRLSTTIRVDEGADGSITFAGDLPVNLALMTVPRRMRDEDLVGTLRSDSLRLNFLKRVVPVLSEASGTLRADVIVGGRLERPLFEGKFSLDSGVLVARDVGAQLRDIVARIALRNDSILIERFTARGERRLGDSVSLSGFAWLPDSGAGAIDLRLRATQFAAYRNKALGSFDVNGELRLSGTREAATLDGDAELYDAIGYLGSKFVKEVEESRLVLDAPGDSTVERVVVPPKPPSFAARLRQRVAIGDLSLRLGDNVRLRSSDANVVLGGGIRATGRLDAVNLSGDLLAKRGVYRLNLGLVSRTFQVDSGRVTFYGPLANSPALDITTTYLVRLENRDQVKVHAQILGTAAVPRIILSSDDQAASGASETELLSYLIFGVPSFALSGNNANTLRSVQNALAPTLGGVAERALSSVLPGVDMLRVTMASQGDLGGINDQSGGLLAGSSITAGQQLGDRVFVSVNTGFCKRTTGGDLADFSPWFGLAVEYRLGPASWLQASMDPGTNACKSTSESAAQSLQFGLDLFREFRFR